MKPRNVTRRIVGIGLVALVLATMVGCHPDDGAICAPYAYSIDMPKGLTLITGPTVAGPWLTAGVVGSAIKLSGTPQGNDFGNFTITASGTYKGFWGSIKTWTYSDRVFVPKPTALTPALVTFHNTNPNPVTATVSATPACVYVFTLTSRDPDLSFPGRVTSNAAGTATFLMVNANDTPRTSAVSVQIIPTGAGEGPFTTQMTVNVVTP